MLARGYEIDVTKDSVELKRDSSTVSLDERIVPGLLSIGFAIVMFCAMFFLPGKHNRPSVWEDLTYYRWPSSDFVAALIETIFAATLWGLMTLFGLRQFFPSGEELYCDRSTLTLAKIPWYNLLGQWNKHLFPIDTISELTYAVVSSGRYGDTYGIRFFAKDKGKKTFAGIEAPEADMVIKGLKSLGVNVIEDQDMSAKIDEALRKRNGLL